VAANLLADAQFLKLLEQATLTNNKQKFIDLMKAMEPSVQKAIVAASLEAREM